MRDVDCLIIGAGFFGLYEAALLSRQGMTVAIIDKSQIPFARASAVNQARIHNGYHYPRSLETAESAAYYYSQFVSEFDFAIRKNSKSIYAISSTNSKTSTDDFVSFCKKINIPLKQISDRELFNKGMVDSAYEVEEKSFDFARIRDYLLDKLNGSTHQIYGAEISDVRTEGSAYIVKLSNGEVLRTPAVINTSYSGVNNVIQKFGYELFDVKYQLCEIIICDAPVLKGTSVTVMDGDFFSIAPYGCSDKHILTSVKYTPHEESFENLPKFTQETDPSVCNMHKTPGCIVCSQHPVTAWSEMKQVSEHYLRPEIHLSYEKSLYEFKTVLKSSYINDSRPTIIKTHSRTPQFVSVLAGKVSTIYDLEKINIAARELTS